MHAAQAITHLGLHKDGAWKITRVISHDHRSIGK